MVALRFWAGVMQHFGFTQAEAAPDLIGLGEVIALARAGWRALAGAALAGAAMALLWLALAVPPDWQAEARVQLAADLAGGTSDRAISTGTEAERLRSPDLLQNIVTRLGFDRDPGFAVPAHAPPLGGLLRLLGGTDPPQDAEMLARHAVARIEERGRATVLPGTTVAQIVVHDDRADRAAAIAQAWADSYVAARNARIDADDAAAQAALARLAEETETARAALARYHAGKGDDSTRGEGLAVIDRELRSSRARLDRARNALRDGETAEALSLRQQTRQAQALADSATALAPELAEQDRLAQDLSDATARLDRAREAWLRRTGTLQRAAILSSARLPLQPATAPAALIAALGAAAGAMAALAWLLWQQHRRGAPRRIATALGLRLIAARAHHPDAARRRADGARIAAALPPDPLDLAVLPLAPAQSAAAAMLAADIAGALAARDPATQLILCDMAGAAAPSLAPAAFGASRPAVVHLGAAMLAAALSTRPTPMTEERMTVTLTPPATDWRGPAMAARSARVVVVADAATQAALIREARVLLRETGLRPDGVVVLTPWTDLP